MPSSAETRTALLKAALVCFAEHGFDGTSMRMIAEKAERPLSLLAHYFGNKEGLYLEVFRFILEPIFAERAALLTADGGPNPRDRQEAIHLLREQIHMTYREAAPDCQQQDLIHEHGTRLWLQEMRTPRRDLHPLLMHYLSPTALVIRRCIQVIRPELGEQEATFLGISVMGMVVGHGLMTGMNQVVWGDVKLPWNAFQAAERLVDLCLGGLLGAERS